MFSSSFTMSEQQHRQWTPYKHSEYGLDARPVNCAGAEPSAGSILSVSLTPPHFVP
jgi:hypothetical protein